MKMLISQVSKIVSYFIYTFSHSFFIRWNVPFKMNHRHSFFQPPGIPSYENLNSIICIVSICLIVLKKCRESFLEVVGKKGNVDKIEYAEPVWKPGRT